LLLLAITAALFLPGKDGPWLFDDKHNIVHLQNLQPEFLEQQPLWRGAMVNNQWLSRSLARFSFALNVQVCGLEPSCFKAWNIGLHLLTALALYGFLLQLLNANPRFQQPCNPHFTQAVALFATALWALHPIQVSTVLYAVQRMTILSALFSLLALNIYYFWRTRFPLNKRLYLPFLSVLLFFFAFHSKENAAIAPLLLLCTEYFLPPRDRSTENERRLLWGLCAVALIALLLGLALVSQYDFFLQYPNRPFSPWERLLSQGRVLLHYLYWIFYPATSHYTLFHDDIAISTGLLSPVTTLIAWSGLAGISGVLLYYRHRLPIVAFGWFWFLLGHAIESSFLNLELVFEHRNYLPLMGLVFAFSFTLLQCLAQRAAIVTVLGIALLVYCGSITFEKAYQWRSDGSMLVYESQQHPNSMRLNYKVGFLWLQLAKTPGIASELKRDYIKLAEQSFSRAENAERQTIHGYIGRIYLFSQGYGVRDDAVWQALYQRLEHQPPTADIANLLGLLTNCFLNQLCLLEPERLAIAYNIYLQRPIKRTARMNAEQDLARLKTRIKLLETATPD